MLEKLLTRDLSSLLLGIYVYVCVYVYVFFSVLSRFIRSSLVEERRKKREESKEVINANNVSMFVCFSLSLSPSLRAN